MSSSEWKHPKFVQVTEIIVVDILEACRLLLSRDWSEKLNEYFSTNWAHLWFPLKGHNNMIRIDRERYLKHTITDLETLNKPSSTDFPVLGNYSWDSDFRNFSPLSSNVPHSKLQNYFLIKFSNGGRRNHLLSRTFV
jgi:hypothetical protein